MMSLIENDKINKNFHKYKFRHFLTFAKIRTLIKDTFLVKDKILTQIH